MVETQPDGTPAARRAVPLLAALALPLLAQPAMAAGAWDLSGGVGINVGRADNPRFLDTKTNPAYDPNNAICTPSTNPLFDPKVCTESTLSSSATRSDYTGTLRLSGGLSGVWPATRFDILYAPYQTVYYERSSLNTISHDLASSFRHSYSQRTSLMLNENFNYTPEQGADPNTIQQQNTVLVRYSSRTNSSFRGALSFQASPKTTLTWTYQNLLRAFSSPEFIDSDEQNLLFQWRRRTGRRSYITSGYQYGQLMFGGGEPADPNDPASTSTARADAQRHTANVGYGFDAPGGLNLLVTTGYNTLNSEDPNQNDATGLYVNGSIGYTAGRASVAAGYNRGFSDGGGVFTTALTQNSYATARASLSKNLSGDLYMVRNANERLHGAAGGGQSVRSFNGRSTLTYSIGKSLGLNASYTYYRQGTSSPTSTVPEIRSNRYSLGMTWSFR